MISILPLMNNKDWKIQKNASNFNHNNNQLLIFAIMKKIAKKLEKPQYSFKEKFNDSFYNFIFDIHFHLSLFQIIIVQMASDLRKAYDIIFVLMKIQHH